MWITLLTTKVYKIQCTQICKTCTTWILDYIMCIVVYTFTELATYSCTEMHSIDIQIVPTYNSIKHVR